MNRYLIAASVLLAGSLPAAAFNAVQTRELKGLSGTTRFVEACSLQALLDIARDRNGLIPTHATVDALGAPYIKGASMTGNTGAVRSRDKWYQFSFDCKTTPDHLRVTSFKYKIGKPVPKAQWAAYHLYK